MESDWGCLVVSILPMGVLAYLSPSSSWVGYEKEGFRGHQYLLEEGEYADWSHWGGYDELLTSLRVIRTVSRGDWALWPHPNFHSTI